jgi:tellurite resistance-related uncharacterized protein
VDLHLLKWQTMKLLRKQSPNWMALQLMAGPLTYLLLNPAKNALAEPVVETEAVEVVISRKEITTVTADINRF